MSIAVLLWDQGDRDGDPAGALTAYDKALAALDAALALDPEHVLAHYNRGIVLGAKGDEAGALAAFDAALALDPEHVEARVDRGVALSKLGDPAGALAAYDAALALDPEHVRAHVSRGGALASENGGDKLVHGSGGISQRGRSKTLPPVAFDLF